MKDGERKTVQGVVGESLLAVAHHNEIELEGACEGSLACSTCHVIVNDEWYDQLPEPLDEEYDMLDLAFGLTETYVDVLVYIDKKKRKGKKKHLHVSLFFSSHFR